ncbi:MAG: hypothetical protein KDB68_10105 [Planctomycetes bacterium]|nr:hypothetical protein [Planctomycetota bacterium]
MKQFLMLIAFAAAFCCVSFTSGVTAQDAAPGAKEPQTDEEWIAEYVARSERLRDFGYPLLAREQLDKAKKLDPTAKPLLLEYIRLFTKSEAKLEETFPYVAALRDLYPNDYDSCLEIARFLFLTDQAPIPPIIQTKEDLKAALERLDAEMAVFRQLAKFVLNPEGDLPKVATGKPALPLAYLARCAKAKPGQGEVLYLAARDLDMRGGDFDRWSRTDENLKKPFDLAAQEVYGLVLPLYQAAAKTDDYNVSATTQIPDLLFRMHKYEQAYRAVAAAELVQPGDIGIAKTRLAIAEESKDFEQLNDALAMLDKLYGDITSRLDISAAKRIQDNGWDFNMWLAYQEIQTYRGDDRADVIHALIEKQPEFIELYYLDARHVLQLAPLEENPQRREHLFEVVLKALDKCASMGAYFADWYGLRAAALWELGRFEEAAKAYDRVSEMDKNDEEATRHAAAAREIAAGLYTAEDYEVYRQQLAYGDLRDKRKILRLVVTRAPKFFSAQLLLGKVSFMLGDWETAYGAYAAGHGLEPENLECLDGAARAAMRTSRLEASLKYFKTLNELEPDYQGCERWIGIIDWVAGGGDSRKTAFERWLESQSSSTAPTARVKLLEEAILLENDFAEVLVELAGIERVKRPRIAENYLNRALQTARDDETRAAAHRERGRLFLSQSKVSQAISEFDAAFALVKGDGTDLLLAALSYHQVGEEAKASAAMRRLFDDVPESPLLRPKLSDLRVLGLPSVESAEPLPLYPAYDVGDVVTFHARLEVEGKGGGQPGQELSLEYDVRLEIIEKPLATGIWRMKLSFENVPDSFAPLANVKTELKISPWFGMIDEPVLGDQIDVAGPVLQAITEGFTAGIGDAFVRPPYVWKNDLTNGPPHFGGDGIEASCLAERLGDSFVIIRRGIAGRQLGGTEDHYNYSRALEANVSLGGTKRAIRDVEFRILTKRLTPEKDDVAFSRLQVKITAK